MTITTSSSASSKKRGLGRGLVNLLSENLTRIEPISTLPVSKLCSGKYQPRQTFSPESLQELAESIRTQGIIQPIIVRQTSKLQYEIIAGERRFRAAQLAGFSEVPVIVRNIPDEQAVAVALIENIQRENLNALEEAQALKRLQEEFSLNQTQIAEAVGKSRVSITHLLKLLDLHPDVQKHLQTGLIDKGHAKALMGLTLTDQSSVCAVIVLKGLSVRESEKLAQQWSSGQKKAIHPKAPKNTDPDISALERQLSDKLSTPVMIQHNKKGRGKLIIHYRNLDILDDIFGKLKL